MYLVTRSKIVYRAIQYRPWTLLPSPFVVAVCLRLKVFLVVGVVAASLLHLLLLRSLPSHIFIAKGTILWHTSYPIWKGGMSNLTTTTSGIVSKCHLFNNENACVRANSCVTTVSDSRVNLPYTSQSFFVEGHCHHSQTCCSISFPRGMVRDVFFTNRDYRRSLLIRVLWWFFHSLLMLLVIFIYRRHSTFVQVRLYYVVSPVCDLSPRFHISTIEQFSLLLVDVKGFQSLVR